MLHLISIRAIGTEIEALLRRDFDQMTRLILKCLVTVDHKLCGLDLITTQEVFVRRGHQLDMQAKPRFVHLMHEMVRPVNAPQFVDARASGILPTVATRK